MVEEGAETDGSVRQRPERRGRTAERREPDLVCEARSREGLGETRPWRMDRKELEERDNNPDEWVNGGLLLLLLGPAQEVGPVWARERRGKFSIYLSFHF